MTRLRVGTRVLDDDTARYVLRVHRLGVGDAIVAFDPESATEADGRIVSADKHAATVELDEPRPASIVAPRPIVIIQGLAKGDKMDAIVRDATELGATRIAPAFAARSIAQHKGEAAVERWRRIALEAARQCGRGDAPTVDVPRPLPDVAREALGLRVMLVPGAESTLGRVLADAGAAAPLVLAIGPEGGLTAEEIADCASLGFVSASLGRLAFRTETACAAALGAVIAVGDAQRDH